MAGIEKDPSQWVFLMNDGVLQCTDDDAVKPTICKLRHPKTDSGSMFLFNKGDQLVYEITKFKEPCGSWFIDERVQHDGGLYITTEIDATYLALPYLLQAEKSGKYQLLDQVVTDDEYPECDRLCRCVTEEELSHIADAKGSGDIRAYRYSEEKTLTWLKKKVEQVADRLQSESINVSGGSVSHVFVRSSKTANSSTEDYMRFAHGMVSDYIPIQLSQQLRKFLGIKDPEPPKHEKPEILEPAAKKAKTDKIEPSEDYSQQGIVKDESKKGIMTSAQNKLNKVDKKGMKSISSFFSPKGKK